MPNSSQQRTAAAQQAGLFADEIVPLAANRLLFDKEGNPSGHESVVADRDECNRASTTLEGLQSLKPVWKNGKWVEQGAHITAGNASQLSDGAAACLLMSRDEAKRRGLAPLGIYRGIALAGCKPEEMGIGPAYAVPKLLERFSLRASDIDLWEINEAFACQVLHCRDALGIPNERLNVNTVVRSSCRWWRCWWRCCRSSGCSVCCRCWAWASIRCRSWCRS
jgi:acetyl-CoA C-acetyltransferase